MADISVTLILDDSQYQGKLKAAVTSMDDLGKKGTKATGDVSAGLEKNAVNAEAFKGKMEKLQTILLGAGFVEFARRSLETSKQIVDLSKGSDISIPKILQLREAFEANGGSAEKLGKIISKLSQSLEQAREGSATAQETLLKLGLTFKDMASMGTEDALQATISKLAAMEDPIKRNALALQIFGKEAKNINWKGIQDGTSSSTEEYNKYSDSLNKAQQAQIKLEEAATKLQIAFVNLLDKSGILGFINNMNNDFAKFEKIVTAAGIAFGLYFGASALIAVKELGEKVLPMLIAGFDGVTAAVVRLDTALGAGLLGKFTAVAAAAYLLFRSEDLNQGEDALIKKIHKQEDELAALPEKYRNAYAKLETEDKMRVAEMVNSGKSMAEAIAKIAKMPSDTGSVKPAWMGELQGLKELSTEYDKVNTRLIENYNVTARNGSLTTDQVQRMTLLRAEYQKYEDQLDAINKQERMLRASENQGNAAATADKIAELEKQKTLINEYYTKFEKRYSESIDKNQLLAREFNTGWKGAFTKYVDDATNAASQGKAVFDVMTNAMNSAIDEFVMKGTFSFKSFSIGIIQELEKIALKAAAAQVFKASGMGDLFGAVGGHAMGGSIPAGQWGIVGEQGPELVKGPAAVTTNNNTAGIMGGGQTIINNISAIDSKSVAQLFAENRMTLFGTVEQARRELPMRTR
jgi:lambda family phage tail tape measure protein